MDRLLEATARAERDHFWFRGFRRFVSPMLDRASAGRRDLRLLDCGCGTGTNLRVLLEPYGRAWGFDLTWTGLQFARGSGVTRVAQASAAAIPYPSAAFDIVTSFDVLYCLPDGIEREAIREMWRVLRPGGAAIINVAAMEILRGNHSVLSAELRRYSRASLRERLERAGFGVERMTYTNAAIFPVMLAVRGVQRMTGLAGEHEAGAEITVPPAPINAALGALLAVEAGVVRALPMPFGSSLLCLARKPA
ncbi:MAG: class I SAM-dependent methyltransferase [Vicinamibacterales bacterium]|nr:class I SAM-dependent methyltransferase [Vicinamibacterales bacterium]